MSNRDVRRSMESRKSGARKLNADLSQSSLDDKKRNKKERMSDSDSNHSNSPSNASVNFGRKSKAKRRTSKGDAKRLSRKQRMMQRMEMLARPNARRLRSLWDDKCAFLPRERRDKIKSALEEDYFLSPEQTEQYFQTLSKQWQSPGGMASRKEQAEKAKEVRQRQKWLVNFSAQVAYRLCDYIAKGQKEMLVSNRLRSIADVVLEKVAEILGEPKPTRTDPGRLARFMVAVSDRIAVWIENAAYRADALELNEETNDDHMQFDHEKVY